MAASPLVAVPTDALQASRPGTSPLKRPSSSAVVQATSSGTGTGNGTPRAARNGAPAAMDLLERLNEDEKTKYVKGTFSMSMYVSTPR